MVGAVSATLAAPTHGNFPILFRTTMRILVIGSNGQIGWELVRLTPKEHECVAVDRSLLDLSDAESIVRTLREVRPNLIVNAAGYTAVDKAESEPELAMAVNGTALRVIGETARAIGAAVIHYSTDYVFDGTAHTPYRPSDKTNPLSVYGKTKLAGEVALMESGAAAMILRTSWVYGTRGKNFLLTMLNLARTRPELRIVNDQTGSPTWSRSIALATRAILQQFTQTGSGATSFGGCEGIYHLTSAGSTTWFAFASRFLELAAINPKPRLTAITTEDFGAPARRPMYSVLDCSVTRSTFGLQLPAWDADVIEVMRELNATP